jgi:hypothetical protein
MFSPQSMLLTLKMLDKFLEGGYKMKELFYITCRTVEGKENCGLNSKGNICCNF